MADRAIRPRVDAVALLRGCCRVAAAAWVRAVFCGARVSAAAARRLLRRAWRRAIARQYTRTSLFVYGIGGVARG